MSKYIHNIITSVTQGKSRAAKTFRKFTNLFVWWLILICLGGWLLCKEGSKPTGFNDNVDLFCDDLQFVEMCGKCFDKFRVSIGLDFRLQRSGCLWTSLMSLTSEMQKLWNYTFFTPKCEPECKFKSKDNRPQLKMGANTKFYDIAYHTSY